MCGVWGQGVWNEGVENMGAGSLGEVLRVIDKYVIQILDLSTLGLQNVRNAVSVKVFNLRIMAKNCIVRRPAGGFDYLIGN